MELTKTNYGTFDNNSHDYYGFKGVIQPLQKENNMV
jgi:hypothetical protein